MNLEKAKQAGRVAGGLLWKATAASAVFVLDRLDGMRDAALQAEQDDPAENEWKPFTSVPDGYQVGPEGPGYYVGGLKLHD